MCVRYTQTKALDKLRKRFGDRPQLELSPEGFVIRFNIAPSQNAPVILNRDGLPAMSMLRWGLVPFLAKDEKIGYKMINAMAETVAEKPSFRNAFKKRRCLVPADGFYEWKKYGAVKIPHWFTMRDGEPFAFALLWESWKSPDKEVDTFTIITTEPNELVSQCHNRLPVILPPEYYEAWLGPNVQDADRLKTMLKPFPAGEMKATVVSTYVSNARNEGPRCIETVNSERLL